MILDAGCGRGRFLEQMRAEGNDAIGIDIDKHRLAGCRKKGLNVYNQDITKKTKFKSGSFNFIECNQVIEHLDCHEAEAMLKECARLLEKGGTLRIYTLFNRKSFYHTFDHVKPYPPQAFIRFFRHNEMEGKKEIPLKIDKVTYKRKFTFYPVGFWIYLEKE